MHTILFPATIIKRYFVHTYLRTDLNSEDIRKVRERGGGKGRKEERKKVRVERKTGVKEIGKKGGSKEWRNGRREQMRKIGKENGNKEYRKEGR